MPMPLGCLRAQAVFGCGIEGPQMLPKVNQAIAFEVENDLVDGSCAKP
jgi:hypothetical protein